MKNSAIRIPPSITLNHILSFTSTLLKNKLVTSILGFLIIVSGTLKLQHAINLYRIHMQGVKSICILGLINIILGIVIVFNPFKTMIVLMRVMGIGLLVSGISDLCASVFMKRQFKIYDEKED